MDTDGKDKPMLTEEQRRSLIAAAITGARAPMKRHLGSSPKGYDAADEIAEGIGRGIERWLAERKAD